jgi:senataxin
MVTQDLTNAKLLDQLSTKTLLDIHPATVYRMVCNWTIFSDPGILSVINSSLSTTSLPGWPRDPLPSGMFVLLLSDNLSVRQWAVNQALKCTTVPMSNDLFVGSYLQAIEVVGRAMTLSETTRSADPSLCHFSLARDPCDLWSGFSVVLRHIPVDALASDAQQPVSFRRIVTGHLHDTGPR